MEIERETEINQNHVIIRFFDFKIDPNEITDKLKLNPTLIARQGDDYYAGPKKTDKKWEFNHWEYEISTHTNDYIGETITQFFNETIIPRLNEIREISQKARVTRLIIVQYYYTGCNPGYSFESDQIKILAEINAEIDMDIYCLSED